tara:strand:+ start:5497 stop:6225 length:729 start_codon:yes stop_codon:yes gene_type:complete
MSDQTNQTAPNEENDSSNVENTSSLNLESINKTLSTIFGNLTSSTALSEDVITNQKKMTTYLDNEQTRLSKEKEKVDTEVDHMKREAILNDTRKKRTIAYNYILIVFILTTVIGLVIHYLKQSFSFIIPSFLFNFLIILTLSSGLIYMINLYLDIIKRDPIYYDKLIFQPPKDTLTQEDKDRITKQNDLAAAALSMTCQNGDCCDKETNAWDNDKGLCMPIVNDEKNEEPFINIFKNDCCKL